MKSERCGVCGKPGDPRLTDGGMIACGGKVRWACSMACFNIVYPARTQAEVTRDRLNNMLLSYDKDAILLAIKQVVPIADAESIDRIKLLAESDVGYVEEIREAAREALQQLARGNAQPTNSTSDAVTAAIDALKRLPSEERLRLFARFCNSCGGVQPAPGSECRCWGR